MKKLIGSITIVLCTLSMNTMAEGVYAGFSTGNGSYDDSNLSDTSLTFYVGKVLSETSRLEISRNNYGEPSSNQGNVNVKLNITGTELSYKFQTAMGETSHFLLGMGLMPFTAKSSVSGAASGSTSDSGMAFVFDFGIMNTFSNGVSIRGDYEFFTASFDLNGQIPVEEAMSNLSVGLAYNF